MNKNTPTKRLYFDDPYQIKFEAAVVESLVYEDKPAVIIDRTCFYPESGGQPWDRGSLNEITVLKVVEEEGRIIHVLEKEIDNDRVTGIIDWDVRFDHMQQHAGQHILSQSFYKLLNGETRSFHLGEKVSTLEININKITEDELTEVENLANKIVFEDREISCTFVSEDQIKNLPMRKPPVKSGLIRVVEVREYDFTGCGGTHPNRTGEVGLIKIIKWDRIRNNLRFEFVCGNRALLDYKRRNQILKDVSNRFTVGADELMVSVNKLFEDYKLQKKKNKRLRDDLSKYEANELLESNPETILKIIFIDRSTDEMRSLALNMIRKEDKVLLFGLRQKDRVHVLLACKDSKQLDMRELIPVISPQINGKGGGRPSLIEVAGDKPEFLEDVLDKAYAHIKKKLKPVT